MPDSPSTGPKAGAPLPESDATRDLLARLALRSAERSKAAAAYVNPARWSYRQAASVLHCFDPQRLHPLEESLAVANPRELLAPDTQPAAGARDRGLLTLETSVRQEALARLGNRDRMRQALAANPERERTDVQGMLEAFLSGSAPPLEQQSSQQLSATLQVVGWLGRVLDQLPPYAAVRDALARRAPLRRFEHLIDTDFVNRETDLARLRDFVGVLPPSSASAAVGRKLRASLRLERRPPLLLHGPGGIGKSALIGRFLREHFQWAAALRFPFAYLPFDDPLLKVTEPYTLLHEAAQQLAQQFPDRRQDHASFATELDRFAQERSALGGRASSSSSRRARLEKVGGLDQSLMESFADLLHSLAGDRKPALFVLDTFEEVQYRSPEELQGLGRLLASLQQQFPLLRVVASGRAPARELWLKTVEIELGELDPSSAAELLQLQGITDPRLAARLAHQLGGNPLTLRLAARAVTSHPDLAGPAALSDISSRRFWIFSIPQELVQGQLYRRVLDHIHDDAVRKLAHPGMVLRRVTPEAIRDVLAEPCGVEVPDVATADRLFRLLQREHALVRLEDADTLRYRVEVRRPMLRLLAREAPAKVLAIHHGAVFFWRQSKDLASRAEELYHLLALDEEDWTLEQRWDPELGRYLGDALDELPPRAAAWLASHLGVQVAPAVREAASQTDWERSVGRVVASSLRYQDVKGALGLLAERKQRMAGSALYPLEARAHLLTGRPSAARAVLEKGLAGMPLSGSPGRQAEMLWLHAQSCAAEQDLAAAAASLAQAEVVAREIPDRLCRLQIVTQRLILAGRMKNADPSTLAALRARIADDLAHLDAGQIDREPTLVRIAARQLAPEHWTVLRPVLRTVGIGPLPAPAEAELRQALAAGPQESLLGAVEAAFSAAVDVTTMLAVAGALLTALRASDLTLDAANLAGIEEYRERWETESASEAQA